MEIGRYIHEEMPNGPMDDNGTFVAQYNVSITNIHFPSFYVAFIVFIFFFFTIAFQLLSYFLGNFD